jgi:hypothetical protein
VTRRLLDLGVDSKSALECSVLVHTVGSLDILNLIVAYGARFNILCSRRFVRNALQRAARHDSVKLLTEIVRLCFDVHCPGPAMGDRSALQSATARCDEEGFRIMQLLIEEQSADVN